MPDLRPRHRRRDDDDRDAEQRRRRRNQGNAARGTRRFGRRVGRRVRVRRQQPVASDANQQTDVFARTLPNGPTEPISACSGAPPTAGASPRGVRERVRRRVRSVAHNLVGRLPTARNVYVRDRSAGDDARLARERRPSTLDSGQSAISATAARRFASLSPIVAQGNAILVASAIRPSPPRSTRGPRQRRDDPDLRGSRRRPAGS
jgi:hypothetical protein